jgi:hypothetical protein
VGVAVLRRAAGAFVPHAKFQGEEDCAAERRGSGWPELLSVDTSVNEPNKKKNTVMVRELSLCVNHGGIG